MPTYKFRAECGHDITTFAITSYEAGIRLDNVKKQQLNLFGTPIPDMTFTFDTKATLKQIKAVLSTIVDGHVMEQTVALEKKYDGVRRETKAHSKKYQMCESCNKKPSYGDYGNRPLCKSCRDENGYCGCGEYKEKCRCDEEELA